VLGRVLGPKRDEVTGDWRKLPSVTKYYSGDKIKNSGVSGECGTLGGGRGEVRTEFWCGSLGEGDHLVT
jgi:hypothetical protein